MVMTDFVLFVVPLLVLAAGLAMGAGFTLWLRQQETAPQKPWTVDRDGRVRTDRDRPVVVKASK